MENQKDLIEKKDWNVLIILDACRYDYFEKMYKKFFSGTLKKINSSGTHTPKWIATTFREGNYEDVVYISGNPFINSRSRGSLIDKYGFDPAERFYKVIDLWDWGWNEKIKTVLPKKVSKITRLAKAKYPKKS